MLEQASIEHSHDLMNGALQYAEEYIYSVWERCNCSQVSTRVDDGADKSQPSML